MKAPAQPAARRAEPQHADFDADDLPAVPPPTEQRAVRSDSDELAELEAAMRE